MCTVLSAVERKYQGYPPKLFWMCWSKCAIRTLKDEAMIILTAIRIPRIANHSYRASVLSSFKLGATVSRDQMPICHQAAPRLGRFTVYPFVSSVESAECIPG